MNSSIAPKTFLKRIELLLLYIRVYIRGGWKSMYPHIHDIFSVLRCIWFHIMMLGVGYFALTSTEQAQDMLYVLTDALENGVDDMFSNGNPGMLFVFMLSLSGWSFVMWFTARMILKSTQISLRTRRGYLAGDNSSARGAWYVHFIIRFFPRIAGALPFLFVMLGCLKLDKIGFTTLLFGILTVVSFLLYVFRSRIQAYLARRSWVIRMVGEGRVRLLIADPDRFNPHHQQMTKAGRLMAFLALGITLLLFFLLSIIKQASFAQGIGPHGLILSALSCWSVFGSILVLYSLRYRIPGFLLLVLYLLLVSRCNNNHAVRTTTRLDHVDQRPELRGQIRNWMKAYINEFLTDSTALKNDSSEIPIVVVAAQGGGIRAMNWTARVMEQLSTDKNLPGFYRHVFAVSGVSGGSVGLTVHAAYKFDGLNDYAALGEMVSEDYLSPVTAGLLYPDLVQKFLWWPRPSFDRARRLEDSWSEKYTDVFKPVVPNASAEENKLRTLDHDFLSLWKKDPCKIPSIFLNSVVAESGQKAIISNIQLDGTYFPDAIDVIHESGYDMPIKSAALCSARFPYVTPGGLIHLTGADAGHLIDGGYLENTGMVTALSVLCAINDFINDTTAISSDIPAHIKKRFRPVMVFIQNADFGASEIKPIVTMHEILVPPSGFIKSWDREGVALDRQMKLLTQKLTPKVTYVKFELDRTGTAIPLSWYISKKANEAVAGQVNKLAGSAINKEAYSSLHRLFSDLRNTKAAHSPITK